MGSGAGEQDCKERKAWAVQDSSKRRAKWLFMLSVTDNIFWLHGKTKTACGSVSERAVDTYPAKLVGALHAAHLYVSILSSWDNLHTLKVTSQDHYITT